MSGHSSAGLAQFVGAGLTLVITLLIAGCSDVNSSADGGEAGTAGKGTVLDQCTKIGNAFCAMAQGQCGEVIEDCVNQFNNGCCGPPTSAKCTAAAISSDDDINSCANGISGLTCAQISLPTLPAQCNSVPATPQ